MARALVVASGSATVRNWLPDVGPVDPVDVNAVRRDGFLRDSDGSVYWWMATVLPGFRQFRYPAKLFTLTALAASALAGLGWDRLIGGRVRGAATAFGTLLALTLLALVVVVLRKEPILASFRESMIFSPFGPLDVVAAYRAIIRSLGQAAIVFALGLVLTVVARKRPHLAGAHGLDRDGIRPGSGQLAVCPDGPPIDVRYQARGGAGHREDRACRPLLPVHSVSTACAAGTREAGPRPRRETALSRCSRWDHDTLNPKHGIEYGLEYTYSVGVGELADYEPFFASFYLRSFGRSGRGGPRRRGGRAGGLLSSPGFRPVEYPIYDCPFRCRGLGRPIQGFCSVPVPDAPGLARTEPSFSGPNGAELTRNWTETRDYRVLRNLDAYPRAWVVHDARATTPVRETSRGRRDVTMLEILYAPDPVWHDASRPVYDPRSLAWVRRDDMTAIGPLPFWPEDGRCPRRSA